jgi:2-polyprenyl-3-methyl-5-hydroxy-6-metoxy-1,4-benzoquinol methylase
MTVQPETTIVAKEMERFNRLSATFWNSAGPMRPLHVLNDLRLCARKLRRAETSSLNSEQGSP